MAEQDEATSVEKCSLRGPSLEKKKVRAKGSIQEKGQEKQIQEDKMRKARRNRGCLPGWVEE